MKRMDLEKYLVEDTVSIVDAMKKIDLNAKGILFVIDTKERLCGVATDGDIRRWIIRTGDLSGCISQVMNKSPKSLYCKEIKMAKDYMEKYNITALPVLTTKETISDIVFKEENIEAVKTREKHRCRLKGVPVVIMAGGKGTRLFPYTKVLPKPLIPIGEVPIVERIMNEFYDFGVRKFLMTVNYKSGMIKSYFAEQQMNYSIKYVDETEPLGTAGSLSLIEEEFDKPFILTNCDILILADYSDIYRHHLESGNELTVITALKNIVVPYGVIKSSENGMIEEMDEKPTMSYFVNTGMYILNPELMKDIPENEFYHMTDLVDKLLKEGRQVGMYPISEDSFLDMGEFEEMNRMEKKLNLEN